MRAVRSESRESLRAVRDSCDSLRAVRNSSDSRESLRASVRATRESEINSSAMESEIYSRRRP